MALLWLFVAWVAYSCVIDSFQSLFENLFYCVHILECDWCQVELAFLQLAGDYFLYKCIDVLFGVLLDAV